MKEQKLPTRKMVILSILGILNMILFVISFVVFLLLQFHPPIGGSLKPSIWMFVCMAITMTGSLVAQHLIKKENTK